MNYDTAFQNQDFTIKTNLVRTAICFDPARLKTEYEILSAEYKPTVKHDPFDNTEANLIGYNLRGFDPEDLGECNYTLWLKNNRATKIINDNQGLKETEHANNTVLYRGYFKEILDICETHLGPLYKICVHGGGFRSGLNFHLDQIYFRYYIPIYAPDKNYLYVKTEDGMRRHRMEEGFLYYQWGHLWHGSRNYSHDLRMTLRFTANIDPGYDEMFAKKQRQKAGQNAP